MDNLDQREGDALDLDDYGDPVLPPPRPRTPKPAPTVPDVITLTTNFRIGEPYTHTRSRKWLPGPSAVFFVLDEDDYDGLCRKIRRKLSSIQENIEWPQDSSVYLQPHNTATANHYLRLESCNCSSHLRSTWIKEFRRTKRQDIHCNLFVYLKDNRAAGSGTTMATATGSSSSRSNSAAAVRPRLQAVAPLFRRALQGRIMEQTARIEQQPNLSNLGAIETTHLARTLAGQAPSNEPIVVPRTATFRQMRHLDEQASNLRQHQVQESEQRQQELKTLSVVIAGLPIQIQLNVKELRALLELPDMSLDGHAK